MQNYLCTQLFWVVKTHWLTLKKIPLFMRLFIIMFLFAVGVMRAADSYSQNVLLDIEVQNQTIEKVLGEIEKQSEFTFFYNDKQINVNRLVSVTVTKETIFYNDKAYTVSLIRKDGVTYLKTRDIAEILGLAVGSRGKAPVLADKPTA